jgi:hypothetical protein
MDHFEETKRAMRSAMGHGGLRHLEPEVPEGDVESESDNDEPIRTMLKGAGLLRLIRPKMRGE